MQNSYSQTYIRGGQLYYSSALNITRKVGGLQHIYGRQRCNLWKLCLVQWAIGVFYTCGELTPFFKLGLSFWQEDSLSYILFGGSSKNLLRMEKEVNPKVLKIVICYPLVSHLSSASNMF